MEWRCLAKKIPFCFWKIAPRPIGVTRMSREQTALKKTRWAPELLGSTPGEKYTGAKLGVYLPRVARLASYRRPET